MTGSVSSRARQQRRSAIASNIASRQEGIELLDILIETISEYTTTLKQASRRQNWEIGVDDLEEAIHDGKATFGLIGRRLANL